MSEGEGLGVRDRAVAAAGAAVVAAVVVNPFDLIKVGVTPLPLSRRAGGARHHRNPHGLSVLADADASSRPGFHICQHGARVPLLHPHAV